MGKAGWLILFNWLNNVAFKICELRAGTHRCFNKLQMTSLNLVLFTGSRKCLICAWKPKTMKPSSLQISISLLMNMGICERANVVRDWCMPGRDRRGDVDPETPFSPFESLLNRARRDVNCSLRLFPWILWWSLLFGSGMRGTLACGTELWGSGMLWDEQHSSLFSPIAPVPPSEISLSFLSRHGLKVCCKTSKNSVH